MPRNPEKGRALIDQIGAEQKRFRESDKGTKHWYDDLSADTKKQIEEMGWPREIVAMGADELEPYVKRIGDL